MILTVCQSIWGYFMSRSKGITLIVHFSLHFFVLWFLKYFSFAYGPIRYGYLFNRSICTTDETQTDINTLGQSGPGNNVSEWFLHIPYIWSLTIKCSLVSYPGHPFWGEQVVILCKEYSQCILSPANKAIFQKRISAQWYCLSFQT